MTFDGQKILVVGLGVSGVSAARYLTARGAQVHVTDSRAQPPGLEGIDAVVPAGRRRFGAFGAGDGSFAMAVVSPGISPEDPFVRSLAAAGVEVVGDVELFARAANAPVVGITGSNGKSTVTTLVGEMAKAAGLRVGVGGNLGTPALDLLRDDAQLYVLELSSFQLETTHSLRCKAATILNLSQDHLDRHGTMDAYAAAKARIWKGCEVAVANRDDPGVLALLAGIRDSGFGIRETTFGLAASAASGEYGVVRDAETSWLAAMKPESRIPNPERLIRTDQLRIFGTHNWANALAAIALADAAGIPRAASLRALAEFRGLPHRCEFVAERRGVRYFNDSKGTNVGSTLAAIEGLPAPIVWLAGGQGKGQSFGGLRDPLARKGRAAILFGEDAARIADDVYGALPVYREADMFAALTRARDIAEHGDCVLLSPACASFDQFRNYVDRGEKFRAAVGSLE